MATMNTLPREILHEIISYISPDPKHPSFADLVSCAHVCKSISDVANEVLYGHIDLTRVLTRDERTMDKSTRRQKRLLQTIAENSRVGSMVHTFMNNHNRAHNRNVPTISEPGQDILPKAAENLKRLRKAYFMPTKLGMYVMANLYKYSQLVDLSVDGFNPQENVWTKGPVALRRLKWTFRMSTVENRGLWENANFLINVVEATCPALESLDLSTSIRPVTTLDYMTSITSELLDSYTDIKRSGPGNLVRLEHFGCAYAYTGEDKEDKISAGVVEFTRRYAHTLTSVNIPVPGRDWTTETVSPILEICLPLSGLKSLSLTSTSFTKDETTLRPFIFLKQLTESLAAPKYLIERFDFENMKCSYSGQIGRLFQSWSNLKYLHISDDMNDSLFDSDGRPDFRSYRPEILAFVKALPPSLEDLMLDFYGPGLACDGDEDFDPIANMGPEIFTTLRRLRRCDIQAWISSLDSALGTIPEKAVMHRRLPQASDAKSKSEPWKRELWTSRLNCVYQGEHDLISVWRDLLELENDEEPFGGRDADGVWLDGYELKEDKNKGGTRRGMQTPLPDLSWPVYVDKLDTYEGFRRRHI